MALERILNRTIATGKLARWILQLSTCDFEVVHLAGVKLYAMDTLSRSFKTGMKQSPLEYDLRVIIIIKVHTQEGHREEDAKEGIDWILTG